MFSVLVKPSGTYLAFQFEFPENGAAGSLMISVKSVIKNAVRFAYHFHDEMKLQMLFIFVASEKEISILLLRTSRRDESFRMPLIKFIFLAFTNIYKRNVSVAFSSVWAIFQVS